ncbi:MAG TPA: hypothetical protein VHA34_10115, partial [Actinomycetes bacterium]|nr:hypothetical protein [Actinomycetes bacterium]
MLLTGPFGGLTDDVREFLLCLADEGLPLTGWGDLDPASLRTIRERLPGGGAGGDGPDGLALARRRTTLLRSLCDAGRLTEAEAGLLQLTDLGREFLGLPDAAQLGFVFAAWWEGVDWGDWAPRAELGRLLWHERDTLLQELAGLPPGHGLSHPVGSVPAYSDPYRRAGRVGWEAVVIGLLAGALAGLLVGRWGRGPGGPGGGGELDRRLAAISDSLDRRLVDLDRRLYLGLDGVQDAQARAADTAAEVRERVALVAGVAEQVLEQARGLSRLEDLLRPPQ